MKNFPHEWREIIKLYMNRITILAAKVLFVSSSPSYLLCGGIYRTFMREFDSGATRHNSNPRPYSAPGALGVIFGMLPPTRHATDCVLIWLSFRSLLSAIYLYQTNHFTEIYFIQENVIISMDTFYPDW